MTTYTIVELTPTVQEVGTLPPGWLDEIVTPDPMGDVGDDSDATYTTLGGERTSSGGARDYAALLSCTFQHPGTATKGFIHMRVRAKDTADYLADPDWLGAFGQIETLYLDGDELLDEWRQDTDQGEYQLQRLVDGEVSEPEWFRFYYLDALVDVDPTTPTEDTWGALGYDSGYTRGRMLDAIQGDGLRVALYVQTANFDLGWRDFIDLYEIRLVLAIPNDFTYAGTLPTPVTQLWPRDDNLGLGTTNRIHPPPRANRIIGAQP